MKLLKKSRLLQMLVISVILISMAIPVYAIEHDIKYNFALGLNGTNSYLSDGEARYRETVNTGNRWKVEMKHIYNDSDGIATYWISTRAYHTQVSDAHNVHAGTGPHYYPARTSASETWVVLSADNNNNVAARVDGEWDEEVN